MTTIPHKNKNVREANILIAYVTAGSGHRRAAEAIVEALRRQSPPGAIDAECVDLLTDTPAWLRWWYPRVYAWLVRCLPTFWAAGYYALDHPWIFGLWQSFRTRWNQAVARRLVERARAKRIDVVIATHFFPADVVATAQQSGRLSCRAITVITDLFPHRLWLAPGARGVDTVVALPETFQICRQRGIASEQLHILGIPIRQGFRPRDDRAMLARTLGLDPSRWTLLLASGGMGQGPLYRLTTALMELEQTRPHSLQLLVVCGQNQGVLRHLTKAVKGSAMPVRLFGFVETMPELMQASDLLVTKPGGLTVTEALAVGLPMVFCGTIPGQEQFNAEVIVRHGAGVNAPRVRDVVQTVLSLLDDPERLQSLRANALALGKPEAADELVKQLIMKSTVHG